MSVTSPTKVKFDECVGESKNKPKAPPTKRYDRKEIQKRLDVENWMDEQLRDLFDCKVCNCAPPSVSVYTKMCSMSTFEVYGILLRK